MNRSMTISEHLEDLRKRILRMVIAVGIIAFFILGFHITPIVFNGIALYYPNFSPFDNIAAQATIAIKHQLLPSSVQLIQTAPGQPFFAQFYVAILLGFGISFQLPLIMYTVTASGMVNEKFWRRNIRYAIIAMVILGAAITPDGSGVTMWFVSGQMIGLYLIGIILSERQAKKIATLKS